MSPFGKAVTCRRTPNAVAVKVRQSWSNQFVRRNGANDRGLEISNFKSTIADRQLEVGKLAEYALGGWKLRLL
jgi:hypothetical protein